jgi:hypothetical protein
VGWDSTQNGPENHNVELQRLFLHILHHHQGPIQFWHRLFTFSVLSQGVESQVWVESWGTRDSTPSSLFKSPFFLYTQLDTIFEVDRNLRLSPVGVESHSEFSPVGVESQSGLSPVGVESQSGLSPVGVQPHSEFSPVRVESQSGLSPSRG